jgi:hypothetical protein
MPFDQFVDQGVPDERPTVAVTSAASGFPLRHLWQGILYRADFFEFKLWVISDGLYVRIVTIL